MNKLTTAAVLFFTLCVASSVEAGPTTITLQEAYDAALRSNETIKIMRESRVQAESRVDQAKTYIYPRLTALGGYTVYSDTIPSSGEGFLFQPNEQVSASLVLNQPLYTGGRTMAALRTAKKMEESSSAGLSAAQQDLMLNVAGAYYGALKASRSVDISKRSLERMEHHQEVTEREAATRKSKATRSAMLRARSLVSQARIALVRSQDGLKVAQDKLALLTKLPMDAKLEEPQANEAPRENLEQLQTAATENRQDLAAARINKSIADEYITITKGAHYPQLAAVAGASYLNSNPELLMDATTYYAGLRLQIPIFEGGLQKAEVAEARSKARQAELTRDFLRQAVASDVHEAWVNLQTSNSVLETAQQQLAYAKESFEAAEGLFSEGLLPSISLIDAEQGLTMAEREVMNTTYDRQLAILRLKKSVGMLGKN